MDNPKTYEQYNIEQFLYNTIDMVHFLVSPLSLSVLMLDERLGELIAFSF
mgnify:CR=1 FL=1